MRKDKDKLDMTREFLSIVDPKYSKKYRNKLNGGRER